MCSIKVIAASSLINREWLKHGRCSKASWVAPTWEWDLPRSRGPFIFGCVGGWLQQLPGLSCSGLFSKEWFRPCVAGERAYSSVLWSRPGTVTGGTPVAQPLMEIHSPYEPCTSFVCITHFVASSWNLMNVTISAIFYLLENPRHYYNITGFPINFLVSVR